ncbi:MAG: tetratricopeptide repeat protein [Armatimonadota bacterium]
MGRVAKSRLLAVVITAGAVAAAVITVAVIGSRTTSAPAAGASRGDYAYGSPRFRELVTDSYAPETSKAQEFFRWMEAGFRDRKRRSLFAKAATLNDAIGAERLRILQAPGVAERTRLERQAAANLHRLIKDMIPRFSLERGYEFRSVVERGERQCLLQSVLIAGLLQAMGVDAGVVMVYRNPAGEESNNGHAAVLMELPDGTDLLVDASDPEPFQQHRGVFADVRGYRFLRPRYAPHSSAITGYLEEGDSRSVPAKDVCPLDFDFIRSQFWYYRGERVRGGILASSPTKDGLRRSEQYLRNSVEICPGNPLAVYMLGRTYLAEGRREAALSTLEQASALYSRSGWVPSGPREALARARSQLGQPGDVRG